MDIRSVIKVREQTLSPALYFLIIYLCSFNFQFAKTQIHRNHFVFTQVYGRVNVGLVVKALAVQHLDVKRQHIGVKLIIIQVSESITRACKYEILNFRHLNISPIINFNRFPTKNLLNEILFCFSLHLSIQ